MVVEAYDIWFQLPPQVLLSRYHAANRQANARLAHQWGADKPPMKQTILVSSQQRCYPPSSSGYDQHCDAVPDSPERPDMYGANTDASPKKFHDMRPRWVNSGNVMGPVGDMKRFLRRAREKVDRGLASGLELRSDQGIFGEVFGEQEVWRQWRRDWHALDMPSELLATMEEGTALLQGGFEFHVGLDYSQELFLPTIYKQDDGQFVHLNNESVIARYSKDLGVSPVRLQGVPADMKKVRNPLADLVGSKGLDWGEMSLYADFFTTAVPVLLHHNAWRDGLKERRITYWDRTWFFPYLRPLLEAHLKPAAVSPLAQIPAGRGTLQYWPLSSESTKRKPRQFSPAKTATGYDTMELESVCRYPDESEKSEAHWYDEVFRDGLGGL